jgi:Domain of unknown function (DUF4260)
MTTNDQTVDRTGAVPISVRTWLRLEGAAAFVAGVAVYVWLGGPWLLLLPLLLLPDASAAGYLAGPRAGALTYNIVHNWAFGLAVLGAGVALDSTTLLLLGAIACAHVGMDRAVGYGLKLPTSFQDTHLGPIGRKRALGQS